MRILSGHLKTILLLNIVLNFQLIHSSFGQVKHVWLTHKSSTPNKIVINWQTVRPGNSVVFYGIDDSNKRKKKIDGSTTIHHVEIELAQKDVVYHYSVMTGDQKSADATFKAYPKNILRVAVIADLAGRTDLSKIVDENVHLLLSCGDHVAWKLSDFCEELPAGETVIECDKAFGDLIDSYPEIFQSIPFMPAIGNHDRQIRDRKNSEKLPAYDTSALAFRHFFELPDKEWVWSFDIPDFRVRFITVDSGHMGDSTDTILKACHSVNPLAEQGVWFDDVMTKSGEKDFVITLQNGQNSFLTRMKKWEDMLNKGTITISGSGYYAERFKSDTHIFYNTSVAGPGNVPPLVDNDIHLVKSIRSYMILTFNRVERTMIVELKELESGHIIDYQIFKAN